MEHREELRDAAKIVDSAVAHLRRRKEKHEKPILRTEFRATGRALCIGHTILGSEALAQANVEHQVGFANGHATIILPFNDEAHLLDPFSPRLRQRIDDKITIDRERAPGVTTGWLNILGIIKNAQTRGHSHDLASRKYAWLSPPGTSSANQGLLISIFESETGRRALELYAALKDAHYSMGDPSKAAHAIISLGNNFPEIDIRTKDSIMIKSTAKRLAQSGQADTALLVTNTYFSNFDRVRDSRIDEYHADCLRYIATATGKKSLGRQALALYGRAKANPKSFQQSIVAKEQLCPI